MVVCCISVKEEEIDHSSDDNQDGNNETELGNHAAQFVQLLVERCLHFSSFLGFGYALSLDSVHTYFIHMEYGGTTNNGRTSKYHIGGEGRFFLKLLLVSRFSGVGFTSEVGLIHDEGICLIQITVGRYLVTVLQIYIISYADIMFLDFPYPNFLFPVFHKATEHLDRPSVLYSIQNFKLPFCLYFKDESYSCSQQQGRQYTDRLE